jgi:molecular chaperone DnaK
MSGGIAIGIDLGTSNSCVSAVVNGKPQVLANSFGERTTASVVSFKEDGEILVGNQAKARIVLDPRHTVSSAKRLIGRYSFSEEVKKAQAIYGYQIIGGEDNSIRIRIRDEDFSLPEVSAFVLREMKQLAEAALGQEVSQAVVTVPAYFNDNQRQATKDAGRIAGLEVLRVLNEPTAAALAYGYGRDLNQRVAIYDLGGGTFDVSVLAIGNDSFEVLSTCGDTYLGGDDFDDRLIDLFAERLQQEHGCNVRTDPIAFEKLRHAAEQAKVALSEADTAQIEIPEITEVDGQAVGLSYELTRQEFDKLVVDLIQRTFKVCDEALQQAHLTVRDLDGMILVGGPTRLPTIRHHVSEYFQREPETEVNPDEVVAVGAGIHAHALTSTDGDDADAALLFDVTPLTLRLGIAGDLTEPIIARNSPLPIDATRMFHPVKDGQESVTVKIYQGESRSPLGNEALGMFEFSGYEPGPRDSVQIEVSFEISTEGIVRVLARDPRTGVAHSTTVSMSSGLSSGELDEIVLRDRAADVVPANAPPPIELEGGGPLELVEDEAPLEAGDPEPGPAGDVIELEEFAPPVELADDDPAIDLDSATQDGSEEGDAESLFDSSCVMLSSDDDDSEPG